MTRSTDSNSQARRRVTQTLESLDRAGVTHVAKVRRRAAVSPSPSTGEGRGEGERQTVAPAAKPQAQGSPAPADRGLLDSPAEPPIVPAAERLGLLQIIRQEVVGCTRCAELATTRTQTVFGTGNPNARLVFVGEAPGADEDRQGEPFVGRAGELLTKIIEACKMKREDVYIANVLKCRPPGNRQPEPDEMQNCRGYLERQLTIIRPEYICCLGLVAARALLGTALSMGRLRGNFYLYEEIPVLCTYHPAYLLRQPSAKREVWEDMKLLMGRMGVQL